MLEFLLLILCIYEIHTFPLANYLGTSLIVGNFIPSILLKLVVYIFKLILLMFSYSLNNTTTLRHLSY
jgi:hypothetical protein